MEDKDYGADANKSKLPVDYISGEKVDQYVEQTDSISSEVKKRLEFLAKKTETLLGGIYAGISARVKSGAD